MANHDPNSSPTDDVLEAVTEAMVGLHERYYGRKPNSARTLMMGEDLLACMLGDVYTDIEKTMIELQRQALVNETRSVFQQAMEDGFIAQVERLTRRHVVRIHLDPSRRTRPRARAVHPRTLIAPTERQGAHAARAVLLRRASRQVTSRPESSSHSFSRTAMRPSQSVSVGTSWNTGFASWARGRL